MNRTTTVLAGAAFALQSFGLWAQGAQSVPVVDINDQSTAAPARVAQSPVAAGAAVSAPGRAVAAGPVASQSHVAELLMLVEQLQQEVQSLRGLVEEQAHQMQKMRGNQRDRYRDLDRRISNLTHQLSQGAAASKARNTAPVTGMGIEDPERPVSGSGHSAGTESQGAGPVVRAAQGSDRDAYQQAFGLVRERAYSKALKAFGDFIQTYPDSALVPNAIFWTGEVYRAQTDYERAKLAYQQLIERFPEHQKTADGHYKLGLTYSLMGDMDQAKAVMKKVVALYSDQSAATLASDFLKKNSDQ